ncbi:MAG: (Fe-S)-binding protein [Acidobacteriota bacterium]|nr:(Fe-S)-binding protein [Acidobacteriota bacterium]
MPAESVARPQLAYDELQAIQKELDKCMHCGGCMAVCPVYATNKTEADVARGKIAVAGAVLEGSLKLDDPEVVDMLFNCLVCKSCMQSCPTKVDFGRIMLALRAAIVREKGLPWLKKAIFSTLKHPELFDRGMKLGAALSGIAFRKVGENGIAPRSPFAFVGKAVDFDENRWLPALAPVPLRDRQPELVKIEKPVARAAFFTGCSMNYFYPETGEDLIQVLKENRVEVAIPKKQACCGIPVFVHGDLETIRELGRRNLDAMEATGAEYLITGCGSCGGAWQHEYKEIFATDPEYAKKAEYWAARTYDISAFLLDVIHYRKPTGKVEAVVTYHDSCHLKKTMKVSREPREILKDVPGVTYKEMANADACCGSGGSYVLTHFGTATDIAERKVNSVKDTGADTVATGCPACMMQIFDNLHRFGGEQKVRHYISILAESYRNEQSS